MSERRATNVTWHAGEVSAEDRERLLGHGAACVWLTGLSGSGKSTLARRIERRLVERGVLAYVLDGDNVRHGLNADLGFGPEDRAENIRRIAEVARLFVDAGAVVLTAFISPYREDRARARALLPEGRFVEVYVATPLEVCEARDPKGLYRRARAGEIRDFTGLDAPYEAPDAPELVVDTGAADVDACAGRVIAYLESRGLFAR
ncbi:MAG TPA: adenylyl-sulfate kinase [Sandaracinaceae bacterium]